MIGFLFSGQGSQFKNMGQDLYKNEVAYREVVDRASEALNLDMSQPLVFDDPNNVQTSILTMSFGIFQVLKTKLELTPSIATGLSLGEYSALVSAHCLDFDDGLRLVRDRSKYMGQSEIDHPGKMVAIINGSIDIIKEAISYGSEKGAVYIANYNLVTQIVIGGSIEGIDSAVEFLKNHGIKRIFPLKVNAVSHTPFMQDAAASLKKRIESVEFNTFDFPVISNTTVKPFEISGIKNILVEQLVKPTHFSDDLDYLANFGCDTFVEIGPGNTLMKLAQKSGQKRVFHVDSVETLADLERNLNK
ncbi:ACP S-malonyltransferase [Companilactobacillus nuruki]|uniref:Malonyl CoA-acyl carrier protein transacylase n=1 Tax=Companilactobacillus nuruki TaxID=1993540 RepID=A0A2N7AWD6_9LACO|nr:ACP S-malonyltransferase [Companilactobacillus nuruki]PMD73036.1 ACP S-malonyltransferase [Companilactobacillus nuruki]